MKGGSEGEWKGLLVRSMNVYGLLFGECTCGENSGLILGVGSEKENEFFSVKDWLKVEGQGLCRQ